MTFSGPLTDAGLTFSSLDGVWTYTFRLARTGLLEGRADGPENRHPRIVVERIN